MSTKIVLSVYEGAVSVEDDGGLDLYVEVKNFDFGRSLEAEGDPEGNLEYEDDMAFVREHC